MNTLKTILHYIAELLQTLLFRWLLLLLKLLKVFFRKIREYHRRKKLPRAERREVNKRCVPLRSPIYYKPDPLLYSQYYLMEKGIAVTWDNPDIRLKKGGVYVDSSALEADTEYEVEARIWNNSVHAPAPDLPVRFSYLDFGIGTTPIFIAQTTTDLGVKGGPQCPAYTSTTWRTPATAGHYCLQVLLQWSDDAEPNNNLGQENTNVGYFHSPAQFTFTLKNRKKHEELLRLEADTYTIPPPPPCGGRKEERTRRKEQRLARHRKEHYPIPEGWTVEILPQRILLQPGEEKTISVRISAPETFKGEKTFNINGFDTRNDLVGGVTFITKTQE